MGTKVKTITRYDKIDAELAKEYAKLLQRKAEIESALRKLYVASAEYKAAEGFTRYEYGQEAVKLDFGQNVLTATFNLNTVVEPTTPTTQPLYLAESTLNALLHSKLLTDTEKRAVVFAQYPALEAALQASPSEDDRSEPSE